MAAKTGDDRDAGEATSALVRLMDRLRADCPWDKKQTLADLGGYLLEETYEALEALEERDLDALEGELGDLLFQIVFQCRIGSESGAFDLASVARRIEQKLVSRHPHVFGDSAVKDADAVRIQWEKLKEKERKTSGKEATSPFDGLPKSLPALLSAYRITARAADLGFDWQRDADVLDKLDEETEEFRQEVLAPNAEKERIAGEIGDILFTVVNVARRKGIDPEAALRSSNAKFRRRFDAVAARVAAQGREISGTPLDELDQIWDSVKEEET
ncbi:MAG TPA: nucleoside triphosphate pyrophosphohydrolase [Thermoanaerobaculia bacterium]|jgi:ATP diphosphatase|nr:nucleoside triphosphate pyrophosphohydrolase [Thermoanaerobaculia bacterium]